MWGKKNIEPPKPVEVIPPTMLEHIKELTDTLAIFEKDRVKALEALSGDKVKTEKQLNEKIADLRETLAKLKLATKIEEEDLAHMIKMQEERSKLAFDRKIMDADKVHQDEIKELTATHNSEIKAMQEEGLKQMQKMYEDILLRLPNINASLKIKSGNS